MTEIAPRLVSIPKAATALGVSRSTIYKLINTGKLRSAKVAGRHLVSVSDLDAYVEKALAGVG